MEAAKVEISETVTGIGESGVNNSRTIGEFHPNSIPIHNVNTVPETFFSN